MTVYDIAVVGAGPAGLCASVYALRAGKSVVIFDGGAVGGQMTYSPKIENFPGFVSISGNELADRFVDQVLEQGADMMPDNVEKIVDGEVKKLVTEAGEEFFAKAVILANGVKHRMLGAEGEKRFIGHGISFCAVCDGAFFKDRDVVVVGGGNSALQEALLLAETSKSVTVIQNLCFLTGEKKLADLLLAKENVKVIYGAAVKEITGGDSVDGVVIEKDGETLEIKTDGVFIAIGLKPENSAFSALAPLDKDGYYDAGDDCRGGADGVFVAGDCRRKTLRQITTAVADGAVAAIAACRYVDGSASDIR